MQTRTLSACVPGRELRVGRAVVFSSSSVSSSHSGSFHRPYWICPFICPLSTLDVSLLSTRGLPTLNLTIIRFRSVPCPPGICSLPAWDVSTAHLGPCLIRLFPLNLTSIHFIFVRCPLGICSVGICALVIWNVSTARSGYMIERHGRINLLHLQAPVQREFW